MELREETIQTLQHILEDLETCTTHDTDVAPALMSSLQEIEKVIQHLMQRTSIDQPAFQRVVFLSRMLELSKKEISGGKIQDGLWFGRSVITFLLTGTSAGAVPVTAERYH
ncbi:hypothetical protein [Rufibacter tibetensis]|uniref:Uncharacterized protein n=1 Tax=Rufibacter tibetensis TaxID=512763 RepID=A0A0P0C984_9BACT|nr:hypothetical protein [Rufibacter tibetensis]ALJ00120.1 hypothetical protein DC20_15515 [Rufibacter tibetensis]